MAKVRLKRGAQEDLAKVDGSLLSSIGRRRDEEVYKLAESRIGDDLANGLGDI
jgi:hypothetical protein